MVAFATPPAPVPGLPPYDPATSVALAAACRLGLVPGHDGRRAAPAEVRAWAADGFLVGPAGARYRFPAVRVGRGWRTTMPWCCAWVRFVAAAQAGARFPRPEPGVGPGAAA